MFEDRITKKRILNYFNKNLARENFAFSTNDLKKDLGLECHVKTIAKNLPKLGINYKKLRK